MCIRDSSEDGEGLTTLVIKIYPYKLSFVCVVPVKGRDPRVVNRLERFIKECGLVHFTFRSDREPAIVAMLEEACALLGDAVLPMLKDPLIMRSPTRMI